MERHFGEVLTQTFEPASVRLVMECPLGIMMINMSEIRFETSFITVLDYVIYHFSLTGKCISTFSCLSSRLHFNTETCTSGAQFRAYHHASSPTRKCIALPYISVLAALSRGLMSVVRSLLKSYAIRVIPAFPRLAQILPSVRQW